MKESHFQTLFGNYIRTHKFQKSAVFELKISKSTSLPFNVVKDHQIQALQAVTGEGFYYKITDPPIFGNMQTRFNAPRPFDCMLLKEIKAFIVIVFYHPRKPKQFIFIPISTFLYERDSSHRKSLTEKRALEISSGTIIL